MVVFAMPRRQGNTALHCACAVGDGDAVRVMLGHGADVFARNERGETCFHIAAQRVFSAAPPFFIHPLPPSPTW